MSKKKVLTKVWGLWEPNLDGSTGTLTIGHDNIQLEIEEITIYDYLDFINDLQEDLGQARSLLERMNVHLRENKKDV